MGLAKLLINDVNKHLLEASLTKEGERAVDQIKVKVPVSVPIAMNDEITYLQDIVDLANVAGVFNLQGTAEDESGNGINGTASNLVYTGSDSWGGKAAVFNGSSSKITIPHNSVYDFSGQFDIFIWAKWTTSSNGFLFAKRTEGDIFQDNVYQNNVFTVSGDTGIGIEVNATTAGDVKVSFAAASITSSSAGYNDGNWHLIRVSRDINNLVTLSVDTVSKGTATLSGNYTTTEDAQIGSDSGIKYFNGEVARLRFYSSKLKDGLERTLYTRRNPRTVIKFGGKATKIENDMGKREIIAQSFGKILTETEVYGQVFSNKTPEFIVESIVETNTDLTFSSSSIDSGITLTQYIADGKLIDIIKDLAALTNKVFYTTGNKLLVFDDASFNDLQFVMTHGGNISINDDGYDDTEIVNDLTVLGQNLQYHSIETFSGDNNNKIFQVANHLTVVKVKVGGVEKEPELDYTFDTMSRNVTFTTAPASGSNNVEIDYTYEKPLYIRGTREASITQYGRHAKRLSLPWITKREDGVRFVQSYLNRYKDISRKVKVKSGRMWNSLQENDIVHLTNSIKGIDSDFAIKSIKYEYPVISTEIEVGEYYFDFFEYDKEIVAKIHDLESAVTRVKQVREYESPEELLNVVDSLRIRLENFQITESLSMTATPNIYDKVHNSYGEGSVAITFQPNIFQSNLFSTTPFTSSATSATYGSRVTGSVYVSG